jgi:hypothetical protein
VVVAQAENQASASDGKGGARRAYSARAGNRARIERLEEPLSNQSSQGKTDTRFAKPRVGLITNKSQLQTNVNYKLTSITN